MSIAAPASRWKIVVAFGLVYVFWGSTYLGIGIAVEQIPPGIMCASRFLIAGTLMLAYCALTGRRDRALGAALAALSVQGVTLVIGRGNCPLGPLQRQLGDPAPLFELVLPPRAAKVAIPALIAVTLGGVAILALRPRSR